MPSSPTLPPAPTTTPAPATQAPTAFDQALANLSYANAVTNARNVPRSTVLVIALGTLAIGYYLGKRRR